jgi:hypothetical protein
MRRSLKYLRSRGVKSLDDLTAVHAVGVWSKLLKKAPPDTFGVVARVDKKLRGSRPLLVPSSRCLFLDITAGVFFFFQCALSGLRCLGR